MIEKFKFILFILIYDVKSIIKIPFIINIDFNNINEHNFHDNFYTKELISFIEIGTPPQKIPVSLRLKKYALYISKITNQSLNNIEYNPNLSNTYYKYEINNFIFTNNSQSIFDNNFPSMDNFILEKNYYLNNISFLLLTKKVFENKYNSIIGLKYLDNNSLIINYNLIIQLFNSHNIKYCSFYIEFNNENKGYLIIGNYPHLNKKEKYKIENFLLNKINLNSKNFYYEINMYKFYYGNYLINEEYKITFSYENGLIKGPKSFQNYIENNFFNYYITFNKCYKFISNKIKNNIYYFCNDKKILKNFKELIFRTRGNDFNFTLNYKDLFYNFNNKYYFLIFFDNNDSDSNKNWEFGIPFFQKYKIIFDMEKKHIGYYEINNKIEKKIKINLIDLLILFSLLNIIILLIYFMYYNCKILYLKYIKKTKENEEKDLNNNLLFKNIELVKI